MTNREFLASLTDSELAVVLVKIGDFAKEFCNEQNNSIHGLSMWLGKECTLSEEQKHIVKMAAKQIH